LARTAKVKHMKNKQAGIIGTALGLTLISMSCSQLASSSTSSSPRPQLGKNIDSVTNIPLSYKIETYSSKVMGGNRTYGIALPPGYERLSTQHYPVIVLLHGGHGDPTDWFNPKKGAALEALQQLYAAGKLPPSIIITPDGNDRRGSSPYWDPDYIDGPNGKISTAIGDELVKVIQSRYRTLPAPNFWAIGGLSSGGWGAVNVGLHHLNHFSILFSHSGYFRDKSGVHNSPIHLVKTLNSHERQQIRIYLDTGETDSSFLQENQEFHAILNQLKIKNVFYKFPGQHSWRYWRQHITNSLAFVGEQFQQNQQ
jgi:enterochelin esterase-like enzyme